MTFSEWQPILWIVGFVLYPFVVGILSFIVTDRSGREQLASKLTRIFALFGIALSIWLLIRFGLHPLFHIQIVGSTVLIFQPRQRED